MPSPTADSTQPAIETIREILNERGCGDRTPEDYDAADAALSAVEADLRRKEEALVAMRTERDAALTRSLNATVKLIHAERDRDEARASLAPMSPSEPVPQQAEEER